MRHLFIINPAAGRPESTARLEPLLSRLSFPHAEAYTREAGDAPRLAAPAVRTGGPVRIYACGGDGTLNEVVNGAAGFDNAAGTCVPKGTGNDFLKLFGPRVRERVNDLEALAAGPQRAFDLMDCNGKLGLDVICAGVDARIAAGVNRYKALRFGSGIGAYLLSLPEQVIFRGLCRPLTIRADGLDWQERQTAILCICNGRRYGGGFMPVAEARMDDGVLNTLVVKKVSRTTFLRFVTPYAKGQYYKFPHVARCSTPKEVHIHSDKPDIVTCLDGECITSDDVTIRLADKRLNFFGPTGCDCNRAARDI